jgi:hypothetical protein
MAFPPVKAQPFKTAGSMPKTVLLSVGILQQLRGSIETNVTAFAHLRKIASDPRSGEKTMRHDLIAANKLRGTAFAAAAFGRTNEIRWADCHE